MCHLITARHFSLYSLHFSAILQPRQLTPGWQLGTCHGNQENSLKRPLKCNVAGVCYVQNLCSAAPNFQNIFLVRCSRCQVCCRSAKVQDYFIFYRSAVQLRGMHGARREGGWGAKWQIKSKYVRCTPYPYLTHTHTQRRSQLKANQALYRVFKGNIENLRKH